MTSQQNTPQNMILVGKESPIHKVVGYIDHLFDRFQQVQLRCAGTAVEKAILISQKCISQGIAQYSRFTSQMVPFEGREVVYTIIKMKRVNKIKPKQQGSNKQQTQVKKGTNQPKRNQGNQNRNYNEKNMRKPSENERQREQVRREPVNNDRKQRDQRREQQNYRQGNERRNNNNGGQVNKGRINNEHNRNYNESNRSYNQQSRNYNEGNRNYNEGNRGYNNNQFTRNDREYR